MAIFSVTDDQSQIPAAAEIPMTDDRRVGRVSTVHQCLYSGRLKFSLNAEAHGFQASPRGRC